MKHQLKTLWLFGLLLLPATGFSQRILDAAGNDASRDPFAEREDSVDKENIPIGYYIWKIDQRFGTVRQAQPDTLAHLFPNEFFTDGRTGNYSHLGNLGSARLNRLYFGRQEISIGDEFIFEQPYDYFITQPRDFAFTNTKSPFTNLTYHSSGSRTEGEDRFRALFATNVNKNLGLGFKFDYLYGRGYYANQSTSEINGTLYASYLGERYKMHTMIYSNHEKVSENGGLEDDAYVTNPEAFSTSYATSDMPTNLEKTWNRLHGNTLFLTHRYNLGFTRYRDMKGKVVKSSEIPQILSKISHASGDTTAALSPVDSLFSLHKQEEEKKTLPPPDPKMRHMANANDSLGLTSEFVSVAAIIHTLKADINTRRFLSNIAMNSTSTDYFADFYVPGDSANDYTKNFHLRNLFALELCEGFNNWVKSGLRLYFIHDLNHFTLPDATANNVSYNENKITLGGQLIKQQGKIFHYNAYGEMRTTGTDWGEFTLSGNADLNIPFLKDTVFLQFSGHVRNERPSFYYRHYHGRNAWWDNDNLDKVFSTRLGGILRYKRTQFSLFLENIKNYTYFSETKTATSNTTETGATKYLYGVSVQQSSKNIQIIGATLNQDFRLGILNWENELTFQTTTEKEVLPVPALNVYSNLFLKFRIAKVLNTEFGADVRYFTSYYAPTYSPLIGQFAVQADANKVKTGNYPIVNLYLNFHLKHTRFYIMASHINYSKGAGNPFLVPHYPINQRIIRFGLSWNFFN